MHDYDTLKTRIEECGVHTQLGPVGQGWGIEQNPHELATFLVRIQELGVQSVLEIGTGYKGGLARFLAHEMKWGVTTVDIQDYGHSFDGITFVILDENGHWIHRYGSGYARHSIASVQKHMQFDLVFIDGNHAYDSVKQDYETYKDLATKAIAFHDIAGLRECEGARKFWEEIRYAGTLGKVNREGNFMCVLEDPRCHQIIDNSDQRAGISWIEL